MKKTVFLIILIILTSSCFSIEKGRFIIQFPIGLTNNNDLFSASGYGINFGKYEYGNYEYKTFSWGVSPKAGYFLADNFVVGVSTKYWHLNFDSDNLIQRTYSAGFFSKLYFGNKKIKPFIEVEGALGDFKNDNYSQAPSGGYYHDIEIHKFKNLTGSCGICYFPNPNLSIDIYARYHQVWEEYKNSDPENTKSNNVGLCASLSIYF